MQDSTGVGELPWQFDSNQPGLEIGPLDRPRISKLTHNVTYVDHLDADALRAKYQGDPGVTVSDIHDVDIVWSGSTSLRSLVGERPSISYVVASHVLEHLPDPIGWLNSVTEVLAPGGVVALVIPDKRYCFDHRRPLTEIWDIVDASLRRPTSPTPRQIYEFAYLMAPADTVGIWRGEPGAAVARRTDIDDVHGFGMDLCRRAIEGEYIDVHCWAFTPTSFVGLYDLLQHHELLDLDLEEVRPTPWGALEFYVLLRKPTGAAAIRSRSEMVRRAMEVAATEARPDTKLRRLRRRARARLGRVIRALRRSHA